MKKFLTVLLALSVVFTYTVSTAFAVTTDELSQATSYANNMITSVANSTKASANASGNYNSTAVDQATEDATRIANQLTNDLITLNTDATGAFDMDEFRADINEWCGVSSADGDHVGATDSIAYAKGTYAAYFASVIATYDKDAKVAAAIAEVNTLKASDYTDQKVTTISGTEYTHQQAADIYIKEALASLNNTATVTAANYTTAIPTILYGSGSATNIINGQGLYGKLAELTTVAGYEEENANSIVDVDHAVSNLSYFAKRTYYDAKKVAANSDVHTRLVNGELYGVKPADATKVTAAEAASMNANLTADINDALEVLTVYFNELDDKSIANLTARVSALEDATSDYVAFTNAIANAQAAKTFFGKVTAYGDDLKDAVSFTGEKKYNDTDIDKAVADAKEKIYGAYTADYSAADASAYFADVKAINDPVYAAINAAEAKWIDSIVYAGANKTEEADKIYCKNYYASGAEWQAAYDEIKADTIKLLEDAKTVDEVNQIMADAATKLAEIRTAANDTTALNTAIDKYTASLMDYATEQLKLLNNNNTATTGTYRPASFTDAASNDITSAYEAGVKLLEAALSESDLPAAYEAAKALFANIKTDAALKTEAAAVQTTIAALPANASLDQEAAFTAAYDAYKAYLANYGAKKTDVTGSVVFESKMNNLKTLQQNAVVAAINAIDDDGVTTAEEVAAARKMYDDYVAYYKQYDEEFTVSNITTLESAEDTVWSDQVAAVRQMIAKLTTESSIEDILAAKDAYDALTGSQQRAVAEAYPYKMELLTQRITAAAEGLKITASSTARKGSITVKWTVKGEAAAVDGYEVFRSTKRNSGYGTKAYFTAKASARTYKNTKSLKKGTRYFYKVRAYVELDGVKYYSDWSNKAYRIAK